SSVQLSTMMRRYMSTLANASKGMTLAQQDKSHFLQRHSNLDSIEAVVRRLTQNGVRLPNDATFVNTFQLARTTGYDYSGLSFYTERSGRYVIMVEETQHRYPWVCVRLPPDGRHDLPLLRACFSELTESHLKSNGAAKWEFMLEADSDATEAVCSLLGHSMRDESGDHSDFHMSDAQCAEWMKERCVVPAGFEVRSVDEKDAELVACTWKYCDSVTLVKERVRHLPSVGVYTPEGQLAAFGITHSIGQLCHAYTFPEYRQLGLQRARELRMWQQYIQSGLRPHKFVAVNNHPTYEFSCRTPYYYEWKWPQGEPIRWNFNLIEYR
ncbi:hypothetical protein PENTCL1PPCAC_4651, partial [Pristionchus entomophagus]